MITRTGVYAILQQDHKILLVKQQRGPHRGKWDLPGGGLEPGETIEEALRRELEEEVGLRFDTMRLFTNLTATTEAIDAQGKPYIFYQIGLVYVVSGFAPSQKPAEMEHAWLDPKLLSADQISPFVSQIVS